MLGDRMRVSTWHLLHCSPPGSAVQGPEESFPPSLPRGGREAYGAHLTSPLMSDDTQLFLGALSLQLPQKTYQTSHPENQ